jgi:HSP20 family molecular chaperone IbpA
MQVTTQNPTDASARSNGEVTPHRDVLRAEAIFTPEADLIESADRYEILMNMPGVREEQIEALVENDVLTVRGHVEPTTPSRHRLAYQEYQLGDFRRVFTLSQEIDRDRIAATVKDGVLRLILPKAETLKARRIAVKAA